MRVSLVAGFWMLVCVFCARADELPGNAVMIRDIQVDGGELIAPAVRERLIAAYRNRVLSSDDLLALAQEMTAHLIQQGFVNSGAIVPDQQVVDGVVHLRVIAGRVGQVIVTGNKQVHDRYIIERLGLPVDEPFNINDAVNRLQLLERDPRIKRLNAELKPGVERGRAVLDIKVEEERAYGASIGVDNYNSPNVGDMEAVADAYHLSLLHQGDALFVNYRRAKGFSDGSARYSFPITARNTALVAVFDRSYSKIVSEPFVELDIKGDFKRYGLALRQPLLTALRTEWSVEVGVQRERVASFLLGEPFSFSTATRNGVSEVNVAELTQEWVRRSAARVLAVRATFSAGRDVVGDATTDNSFFELLAQAEWLQKVPWRASTVGFRAQIHVSNERLPAYRKYGLGGQHTVHGYRESLFTRDNGIAASLEWTIPLAHLRVPWFSQASDKYDSGAIAVVPFVDYANGWDHIATDSEPVTLASAGIGAQWRIGKNSNAELYWARPLIEYALPSATRVLQDDGIHFSFRVGF